MKEISAVFWIEAFSCIETKKIAGFGMASLEKLNGVAAGAFFVIC